MADEERGGLEKYHSAVEQKSGRMAAVERMAEKDGRVDKAELKEIRELEC